MFLNKNISTFRENDITYLMCVVLFVLMCVLFIVEYQVIIFEYKIYSLSTTGLIGILTVFLYGWYASKKGHPDSSLSKHISFSIGLTVLTLIIYLVCYTIMTLIFL